MTFPSMYVLDFHMKNDFNLKDELHSMTASSPGLSIINNEERNNVRLKAIMGI